MSYYIPKKHPKDMTKDELFKTQQEIQKQEKARGGLFPLEVNARPANGEPATVKDMHEDATRKQLTNYYEQTAMAGFSKLASKAIGTSLDKTVEGSINEILTQQDLNRAKALGRTGAEITDEIKNNPQLFDAFMEGYKEYKMTPEQRSKKLKEEAQGNS